MKDFIISVDLAQVNDFTAITIIEKVSQKGSPKEYHLRHIERPERGTTYPRIVDRINELVNTEQLKKERKTVVIDITGVGRPVWDLLQNSHIAAKTKGITITGGNTVIENRDIYSVPKRDLITSLQVAFQNGQLQIANGLPEADNLVRELNNFKVKININGHDQYEAWREGVHDDIVLSVAMGVWYAARPVFCIDNLL